MVDVELPSLIKNFERSVILNTISGLELLNFKFTMNTPTPELIDQFAEYRDVFKKSVSNSNKLHDIITTELDHIKSLNIKIRPELQKDFDYYANEHSKTARLLKTLKTKYPGKFNDI